MSNTPIRSRDNAVVKALAALNRSPRERRERGQTVIDGAHLVAACVAAGQSIEILAISESAQESPEIIRLFDAATAGRRVVIDDGVFDALSPVASPSGIVAAIRTPPAERLPHLIVDAIVLDRVQEPGNAGSILRSARAVGLKTILATPQTVDLWSPKVLRGAMGAHFGLHIHQDVALEALATRATGLIIGTQADAPSSLYQADLRGPSIWILGNEGAGISASANNVITTRLRIPLALGTESLNVAAAAAICLFEQQRQRQA